ncbi:hypothetical protein AB0J28_10885 [Streptosporangium canum]|uniref:hypothetical protein n=1 Tax=Streptosporangium canum TaxID=324952 RepID=UPI003444D0AA
MILTLHPSVGAADYLAACASLSPPAAKRMLLVGRDPSAGVIPSALQENGFTTGSPRADVIIGLPGCDRADVRRALTANPRADVVHVATRAPFVGVVALHKSGTNLVAALMRALGYDVSGEGTGPSPYPDGLWERNEAEYLPTLGPDSAYVVHSLPMPTVGGPLQYPRPLFYLWCENAFPVIYHYRDPRAVVLSLIRYLLKQNASGSFTGLPFHTMYARVLRSLPTAGKRLTNAIDNLDSYLSWSFRDNAWLLDHPDVLTTSYESLVGALGGGRDDDRDLAVAQLMITLGVSGDPTGMAEQAYNPHARTFSQGRAYGWIEEFSDEHLLRFQRRYSDLLERYGYPERGR